MAFAAARMIKDKAKRPSNYLDLCPVRIHHKFVSNKNSIQDKAKEREVRGGVEDYRMSTQRLHQNVPGQLGDEEAPSHSRAESSRVCGVREGICRVQ